MQAIPNTLTSSSSGSLDINKYVLQDCGQGSGTFLKIQRPHQITSQELFSIGKDLNFIVITDDLEELQNKVQDLFKEDDRYKEVVANNKGGGLQINFVDNLVLNNKQHHDQTHLLSEATYKHKFSFTKEESPIVVGRTKDCKVLLKEGALSRIQCTLTSKDNLWTIQDGNGKDKKSTNGTWLWAQREHVLEEQDLFKAGNAVFKVTYLQPKDQTSADI